MSLPKDLQNRGTALHYGLTTIYINHKRHTVIIEHRGNMGNSIKDVEENVDMCLSKGAFKRLERLCESMSENGHPDYYYKRIMKF